MTIFEFAKLKPSQKEELLHTKALLLEGYADKNKWVTIYYLPSFFVEVNSCLIERRIIDIIPYRRGYKLEMKNDVLYKNHRRDLLIAC